MLRWQLGKKNPFPSAAMQFSSSSISHEQSIKIFFLLLLSSVSHDAPRKEIIVFSPSPPPQV